MHEETVVQNKIRVALSAHGVVFRQNSGLLLDQNGNRVRVGVPGMSDLLYIGEPSPGGRPTVAWLEIKTSTGRPSKEQLRFISAMQQLGCVAGIVRSPMEALQLIGIGGTND